MKSKLRMYLDRSKLMMYLTISIEYVACFFPAGRQWVIKRMRCNLKGIRETVKETQTIIKNAQII